MNCLVLSAGGMYGAYQAGAWKALADVFQPDLIVGASIGAVNGWAIAGGCDPDELIDRWLNLEQAARYRWKLPRTFLAAFWTPGNPCSAPFATSMLLSAENRFRDGSDGPAEDCGPRYSTPADVSGAHLVATTAIVGLFDQVRIDGRLYSDGGLLVSRSAVGRGRAGRHARPW